MSLTTKIENKHSHLDKCDFCEEAFEKIEHPEIHELVKMASLDKIVQNHFNELKAKSRTNSYTILNKTDSDPGMKNLRLSQEDAKWEQRKSEVDFGFSESVYGLYC